VLRSTDVKAAGDYLVSALDPELAVEVTVESASWTWDELVAEAETLVGALDPASITQVGISVERNSVVVGAEPDLLTAELEHQIRSLSPGRIDVVTSPQHEPAVCTSRANCHSPLRAGVAVDANGSTSTLGFGVKKGNDKQYLVAGHHVGTTFSHPTLGTIGNVTATAFYGDGADAKAIQATDGQVSNDVYWNASSVKNVLWDTMPLSGMYVCKSGLSSGNTCGTVTDSFFYYYLGNILLKGAMTNVQIKPGDSGAPIYQPVGTSNAYGVGMASSTGGAIARMLDVLTILGMSLVTS
jgi:hypothetical protein